MKMPPETGATASGRATVISLDESETATGGGTTMNAIVQYAYGSANVLELRDIDKPEIRDKQVLVRVHAAGVDRGVWHLMTGLPYLVRTASYGSPAAVIPISASTALQALRDQGQIQPGQKVLVLGGSGGVGTFAVQLAKAFDAEVTGACSTAKVDLVRSIGADHAIDYAHDDPVDGGQVYDLI